MNSTQAIYIEHHKDTIRHSGLFHNAERGAFLQKNVGTNKWILDIGCRNGALTKHFLKGNTILGVDIDKDALEIAKTLGIDTKVVDLNGDWELEDTYDVVVATEIIEHLYFPKQVVEKIRNVLKPKGKLIGSVPNAFNLKNRVRLFLGKKRFTPLEDPTHINHFTFKELKEVLESQFAHVEITPFGKFAWLDRFIPGMFSFMFFFVAHD